MPNAIAAIHPLAARDRLAHGNSHVPADLHGRAGDVARRWVRWLATSVLFVVIFQGVLGGLRVVLVKIDLAIVHACVAQAFFCLAALVAVVTSRWWMEEKDLSSTPNLVHGR